jgi:Ni,Fe-hydrogenase I small subunit
MCIGCVEPGFPDKFTPFRKQAEESTLPPAEKGAEGLNTAVALGLGAVAGATLVGAGLAIAKGFAKSKQDKKGQEERKE